MRFKQVKNFTENYRNFLNTDKYLPNKKFLSLVVKAIIFFSSFVLISDIFKLTILFKQF